MARNESNREDLLAEARALVERIEFRVETSQDPIVAGFRRDGGLSLYFGADPVYQFNAAGELRRAFAVNDLYKARFGQLLALRRERTANEVLLVSRTLSADEQARFLADLDQQLAQLHAAIGQSTLQIVGQVPVNGSILPRVAQWLAERPRPPRIARSPRVGDT